MNTTECVDPSVHGNPFRYCPYCDWREPGHPRAVKGTIMRDDEAYEQCDEKPWMLFIDTPDGAHERRAWSPEPLVAHAMKWAKDRGQYIELTIFGVKS